MASRWLSVGYSSVVGSSLQHLLQHTHTHTHTLTTSTSVSMAGSKKKTKLSPRSKAYAPPSPSPVHVSGESSLLIDESNLQAHRSPPDEPPNSSSSAVASSSVSLQSSETKQRGHNNLSTNDVEVRMILLPPAGSCWEIAKVTRNHRLRGGSYEPVLGLGLAKNLRL